MSFIELRNVTKRYKTDSGDFFALHNVSLDIEAGDFVIIRGRSGSGKSTLLNIVGTIESFEGSYSFQNVKINGAGDIVKANLRQKNIGFVFQEFYLINHQSVLYNVISPLLFKKGEKLRNCKKAALQALESVGMRQYARRKIYTLSGGQKQRVAIARALVNHPVLLLCDEPTGSLDSRTAVEILDILEKENRSGTTVILVTHDPSISFAKAKVIEIADGVIN